MNKSSRMIKTKSLVARRKRNPQGGKARPAKNNNGKQPGAVLRAPVASFKSSQTTRPKITTLNRGGDARTHVVHSEYLGDITGSVLFTVRQFALNPGLIATFPWLYRMALNYESYRFNRLSFHFRTSASTVDTGTIAMAVDYDASDANPVSLNDMFSYHGAKDSQVWATESCYHCTPADLNKISQRYVRGGNPASGSDIKTLDAGNFFLATIDFKSAILAGRLWVSYDVELITPQSTFADPSLQSVKVSPLGETPADPFGTSISVTGALSVSFYGDSFSMGTPGEYLVVINIFGTGAVTPTISRSPTTAGAAWDLVLSKFTASAGGVFIYRLRATNVTDKFFVDCNGWTTITDVSYRAALYAFSNN